jgi:hypothetical protein
MKLYSTGRGLFDEEPWVWSSVDELLPYVVEDTTLTREGYQLNGFLKPDPAEVLMLSVEDHLGVGICIANEHRHESDRIAVSLIELLTCVR